MKSDLSVLLVKKGLNNRASLDRNSEAARVVCCKKRLSGANQIRRVGDGANRFRIDLQRTPVFHWLSMSYFLLNWSPA